MITRTLPLMPESYYGSHYSVLNLDVGDIIYVGPTPTAVPTTIKKIIQTVAGYTIITETFELFALERTRVGVNINAKFFNESHPCLPILQEP